MKAIKDIITLPPREVSDQSQSTNTPMSPSDVKKIKDTIRSGNSKKAHKVLGLPERYRGKALPKTPQAKRALISILKDESLFITGACGSGKTHLAVALMNAWFADGLKDVEGKLIQTKGQAVFLPAVELFLEIKQSFDREGESEKTILDKYSDVSLLVIDDLGAEKVSDWSRMVLYLLIDRRYREMKQTIITSNLSQSELASIDDRIASRLSEMGLVLDLGKKDWRVKR